MLVGRTQELLCRLYSGRTRPLSTFDGKETLLFVPEGSKSQLARPSALSFCTMFKRSHKHRDAHKSIDVGLAVDERLGGSVSVSLGGRGSAWTQGFHMKSRETTSQSSALQGAEEDELADVADQILVSRVCSLSSSPPRLSLCSPRFTVLCPCFVEPCCR